MLCIASFYVIHIHKTSMPAVNINSIHEFHEHDSPSELVINDPNSLIMIKLAHGYTLRFCSSSLARSLISLFCLQILFHSCRLKSSYIILSPQIWKLINYRPYSFLCTHNSPVKCLLDQIIICVVRNMCILYLSYYFIFYQKDTFCKYIWFYY